MKNTNQGLWDNLGQDIVKAEKSGNSSTSSEAAHREKKKTTGSFGNYLRLLRHQLGLDVREIAHCLLYTSPSPRDQRGSRMPSSA